MLLKVAKDDRISFRNRNEWLLYLPSDAMIFSKTSEIWKEIKEIYIGNFKSIVFGKLPDEKEVEKSLISIRKDKTPLPKNMEVGKV